VVEFRIPDLGFRIPEMTFLFEIRNPEFGITAFTVAPPHWRTATLFDFPYGFSIFTSIFLYIRKKHINNKL
jgi:hypothetical protein